jgi:pimeloyl-ACP methyl ester carboxylesterase
MKKSGLQIFKIILASYVVICLLLFFFQERLIFFPEKLEKDFEFHFATKHEELNIKAEDGKLLNGVLFKADSSKGLIFYLHGNAGSIKSWGEVAKTYTDLNYDVFLLDYRGYGKSEGSINGKEQFFQDVQSVYNELRKRYAEDRIVVLGYSIGTGPAAKIASSNSPKLLILQAPYYSLVDMMRNEYPIIPTFILKYRFETNRYIKDCRMPIAIFHGDEDEVIYYGSSLKLKKYFKIGDTLITLKGQGHNGITDNVVYKQEMGKLLEK